MRPMLALMLAGGILAAHGNAARSGETVLLVYTAVEPDMLAAYGDAFHKSHPGIRVQWVRDSSGPVAARLLAEKERPRADAVFGLSLMAMMKLGQEGVLAPYRPAGYDQIHPAMRDDAPEPLWVGLNAWAAAVCVNKPEMAKRRLPRPAKWADLLDPAFKGLVVMPHPASSGTGYFLVDGWLQAMGSEAGWAFMEKLHANIRMYTHSGAKPGQMVAQGETPVGLSAEPFVFPFLKRKAPLEAIAPEEALSWDMEVSALGRSGARVAEAKRFLDFSAGPDAARIAATNRYLPARTDVDLDPALAAVRDRLLATDFRRSARDKDEVIAEWRRRFEGK